MRVLFSSFPAFGHFHPMAPLARALEEAGHQVAFSTAPPFCNRVRYAGFKVFPAGLDMEQMNVRTMKDFPQVTGYNIVFKSVFYTAPRALVPDLLATIHDWRPDLLVHDQHEAAGPIAATVAGIPYVNHSWGSYSPKSTWKRAEGELAPIWTEWGLDPLPCGGMFTLLYLDVWPPSMQPADVEELAERRSIRPILFDRVEEEDLSLLEAVPARPTLYITFGTVYNSRLRIMAQIAQTLSEEFNVVLTVGLNNDPGPVRRMAPGALVTQYIPNSKVLPNCEAVIAHGGCGTVLGALSHGLPLLLIPQGADHWINSWQCLNAGVGRALPLAELSRSTLVGEVNEILKPHYGENARRIMGEIEQMPHPSELVEVLERLL